MLDKAAVKADLLLPQFFYFKEIIKTAISAGETPEIRDACPNDSGRI